jgi:hypothetical protein
MNIYILPQNIVQEPVVREGRENVICVFLSPVISDQVQNFRCISCGWIVFQYTNKKVDAISYGGSIPKNKNALDAQCTRCHLLFRVV